MMSTLSIAMTHHKTIGPLYPVKYFDLGQVSGELVAVGGGGGEGEYSESN